MYRDQIVTAVIVAGGTGSRMNTSVPKQFLDLAGKPVVIHTVEKFEKNGYVDEIVIVCHKDHISRLESLLEKYPFKKIAKITPGGATRQESSYNGLKACSSGTGLVLIHDAARPFVSDRMISETLEGAYSAGAATVAVDVTDTIIIEKSGYIERVPDRQHLKRVQTPQGFRYRTIIDAHKKALEKKLEGFTDDCGVILNDGMPVKVISGSVKNIKITMPSDLVLARAHI